MWAVDRRSQALEDTSRFADALAGRISVQQSFDYYLGWLANPAIQPHFQPIDQAKFAFAKQWGLSLALQDARRVVLSAKRQGKRVILGGHSLGASLTVAYASWDFDGPLLTSGLVTAAAIVFLLVTLRRGHLNARRLAAATGFYVVFAALLPFV